MKTYVGLDAEGFVTGVMHTNADCPPGYVLYDGPAGATPAKRLADGTWKTVGPRPSDAHTFDRVTVSWVLDQAAAWAVVRADRDRRLAATDWRLLRAAETGVPVDSVWLDYRQALRDITKQPDPTAIEWPSAPVASMPPLEDALS